MNNSMEGNLFDKRWLYFIMVAGGVLLSTMDSSMVNVALPEIMRSFHIGLPEVKLVVLVYLMVITVSLVFCGRFADQFGKGNIYVAGMCIFTGGAIACATSLSFQVLILSRAVQAVGASMMMSTGPAIIKLTTPREDLGKTLGLVGVATSFGLMSGPLVSGLILTFYSWRVVFLFSVPLAVLAILVGVKYLIHDLRCIEQRHSTAFDWLGSLLWVGVVSGYVLIVNGSFTGWLLNSAVAILFLGLLLCFVRFEGKAQAPIMPLLLVGKRYYWTSVVAATLSFAALFVIMILLPFYLDYILKYSASRIGLTMMALPISLVIMSPLSGWLYDRMGSARYISTMGLVISSISIVFLMQLDSASSFSDVFWRLAMLGAGQSIFLSPNSASVLTRVPDTFAGITSGILATARNFGMLTGTALAGTSFGVFFTRLTGGVSLQHFGTSHVEAFLWALQFSFGVALLLLLVGCCISWLRS